MVDWRDVTRTVQERLRRSSSFEKMECLTDGANVSCHDIQDGTEERLAWESIVRMRCRELSTSKHLQ